MLLIDSVPGMDQLKKFDCFKSPHIGPAAVETLFKVININEGMGFYIMLGLCFTKQKTSGDKIANKISPSDLLPHYALGVKVYNDTLDIMYQRPDVFPDPVRLALGVVMAWQHESVIINYVHGEKPLNWSNVIRAANHWSKQRDMVISLLADSHYAIYNHVYRTNLIELLEMGKKLYHQVSSNQVFGTIEAARKIALGYK